MEAIHTSHSEPTITSPVLEGVKFKKEILEEELLSLGHTKITPQIATLIGDEVEKEISKRKIPALTSELISELVAEKLMELGLIKAQEKSLQTSVEKISTLPSTSLSEEVLEVLAPQTIPPVQESLKLFSKEPLHYSAQSREILQTMCCLKNEKGETYETPEELFTRVARAIAEADVKYDPMSDLKKLENDFYNIMATREFLPDFSILTHAGKSFAQLFSSYSLLVRDTTESIFETMKQAALLHKRGAQASISFSNLRPSSDHVSSTQTLSRGPVAFMKIFDSAMEAFVNDENSATRDGAFLNIDHPDIFEFLSEPASRCERFKRFVGLSESFMKSVRQDAEFALINPRSGKVLSNIRARKLFKHLVNHICQTGELGLLFLERIESTNPTPKMGFLVATTPDGSQALLPFETSANGFINLSLCVTEKNVDWEKLKNLVHKGVHFLDNTLEISTYPFAENAEITKRNRKIGMGVMGWAHALEKLGFAYDSEKALELASKVMAFIEQEADNASIQLAHKRGSFPNYNDSPLSLRSQKRRQAVVTALADADKISQIAECSPGILPMPDGKKKMDVEWRLRMQAAFQAHTENGVYMPVELAKPPVEEEVAKVVILAHQLGVKNIMFKRAAENASLRLVHGTTPDLNANQKTLSLENSPKPHQEGSYFKPY